VSERVIVDEDGLWLVDSGRTFGYPWPEISGASISVLLLPPDDQRVVTIDVDHVSGHFLSIDSQVEGFDDVVAALATRGGREVPTLTDLSPTDIVDISLVNEPPTA
jgi:hypothetical protein